MQVGRTRLPPIRDDSQGSICSGTWFRALTGYWKPEYGCRSIGYQSHIGIPGNEEADKAAKAAARGPKVYSRKIYYLMATCKQSLRRRVARQWASEWENGTTGGVTFYLEKEPNPKVLAKYTGIRRPLSSLITQLRTGKIGLAHYLHKIRRRDSPRCPCSQGIQTVRHVLTECSRTQDLRKELLGRAHDVQKILKDPALAKSAAILLLRGNLLGQFRDVTEAPEDLCPEEPPEGPGTGGSRTANY